MNLIRLRNLKKKYKSLMRMNQLFWNSFELNRRRRGNNSKKLKKKIRLVRKTVRKDQKNKNSKKIFEINIFLIYVIENIIYL